MAFTPLRKCFIQSCVANVNYYTTLMRRTMSYKSGISLETLYPNSSLKLTTPAFNPNTTEKFSGYIPMDKLNVTYSTSSGPGGQNVNKVHTKVDLRFKLSEADWLSPEVKDKMIEKLGNKLTKEGYLVFRSDLTRSQQLNLADCLKKLRETIWSVTAEAKQPSAESQERVRQRALKAARLRLVVKREGAARRALRQPPTALDL